MGKRDEKDTARMPLVSIGIPNYNYGNYLRFCLDSILQQTYPNIEVYFRDNNSTDDSLEIAMSYREKFREKGYFYSVVQNKRNVGSDKNSQLIAQQLEGEFRYFLASDDAIAPTFIEECVKIFEEYPNVGTVMVHRKEIDENGIVYENAPFYNRSCIIGGEEQAAVYMMAGIAIPGQRMFRNSMMEPVKNNARIFNVAGDWYSNFLAAMVGDVAYIRKPLCYYRVHTGNETNESEKNLLGIFEHYQLINSFRDISLSFGMQKPAKRYDEAVEKLGDMCLRYTVKMLKAGEQRSAERYLLLAPVFKESIKADDKYDYLWKILPLAGEKLKKAITVFETKYNLNRTVSYDPPENFMEI